MEKIEKILVPVDFSRSSRDALEYAGWIAERFHAQIDAMHVWETPRYVWPEAALDLPGGPRVTLADFARDSATRDMDEILRVLAGRAIPRIGKRFEVGEAREAILKAVVDGKYHLVVMGTHGRRGLSHLLMGSVAEQVVRRCPCPVLTVRDGATTGAEEASPPG